MTRHDCREIWDEDDGWLGATCACGWKTPRVPGVEDAVDCMMDHAADEARLEARDMQSTQKEQRA